MKNDLFITFPRFLALPVFPTRLDVKLSFPYVFFFSALRATKVNVNATTKYLVWKPFFVCEASLESRGLLNTGGMQSSRQFQFSLTVTVRLLVW